jgi:hypothetical protein
MDEDQGKFEYTSSDVRVLGKEEVNEEDTDSERRGQSRCLLEWQKDLGFPLA